MHYLYLWQHKYVDPDTDQIVQRTCFGITGDLKSRIRGYEGHVGHKVRFSAVWGGPERWIRDLEFQIKEHSVNQRFVGLGGYKYEWINEDVSYDQIHDWIELTLTKSVDGVVAVDTTELLS